MRNNDVWEREEGSDIWWLDDDTTGTMTFSFDKKEKFVLFRDYPYKLTKKQIEIFKKNEPFWADFFSDREK